MNQVCTGLNYLLENKTSNLYYVGIDLIRILIESEYFNYKFQYLNFLNKIQFYEFNENCNINIELILKILDAIYSFPNYLFHWEIVWKIINCIPNVYQYCLRKEFVKKVC